MHRHRSGQRVVKPGLFVILAALMVSLAACSTGSPGGGGGGGGGGEESPAGGDGGNLEERSLNATDIRFDTDNLAVTAGEPFSVRLNNNDDVEHNFSIYAEEGDAEALFTGEVVAGGETILNEIPALEPGEYYFQCDIHPDMNGTLTVD